MCGGVFGIGIINTSRHATSHPTRGLVLFNYNTGIWRIHAFAADMTVIQYAKVGQNCRSKAAWLGTYSDPRMVLQVLTVNFITPFKRGGCPLFTALKSTRIAVYRHLLMHRMMFNFGRQRV